MSLTKVTSVLIGKDIARTAAVTSAGDFATLADNIADGEIAVVDKNKVYLTAADTIADSDTIFILQGTGTENTFTNESGTSLTYREVLSSPPIEGKNVSVYSGTSYTAKSEEVVTIDLTSATFVSGTDYLLRVVYHDINEHPGQFTATYRWTATSTDKDTEGAALAAKIMAHSGRRISASYSSPSLTLTALPIPGCTSSLNDIDEFSMVSFDVFLNYIDSDGYWQSVSGASSSKSGPTFGSGNWEQVRDAEKTEFGLKGITNQITFPVIKPDFRTVKSETYDKIVIEHSKSYVAPNNQGAEVTPMRTVIYLPDTASQTTDILGQLNPWMASLPGAFATVSV